MPNTELITQLEALQASFSQQQKITNILLTTLKNTVTSLNKLQRAWGDYAPLAADAEKLAQAQANLETVPFKEQVADLLMPDLRQQLKSQIRVTAALKEAIAALKSDPVEVVKLDRAYQTLQADGLEEELLVALEQELQEAQAQLGNVFGAALHARLAELGVEMGGRAPRFEAGHFEIIANFVTRKAAIHYGKLEVANNIPISLEAVIRAYQNVVKSITGRNEDGQTWIKQFYTAYDIARRLSDKPSPRVNIVDCYFQMALQRQSRAFALEPGKRTISDYRRAQFVYDFVAFKHLRHEGLSIHVHTATKSQTDSPSKSLWMVDGRTPHDGHYVADIEFVK